MQTLSKNPSSLTIQQALAASLNLSSLSPTQTKEILHTFEAYECWDPLLVMLDAAISKNPKNLDYYIQLARVHGKDLDDYKKSADICRLMIENCKIDLKQFKQLVLPYVISENNYSKEALLLTSIGSFFAAKHDKIQALERLCHLYEKKSPNQDQLAKAFEKLIELDPENLKALKYFKLIYMQENDWPEVVSILERLIKVVPKQEVYRVSQELSAVNLYQLDNPKMALKILDEYCKNSPLDTSTIAYDAYYRLSDWHGCIGVLRSQLAKIEDKPARSVLHYKIGSIFELISDNDSAEDNYKIAHEIQPAFLEPIEALICIYTDKKEWKNIYLWLSRMESEVKASNLKLKISEVLGRLKSAAGAEAG